MGVLSTGRPLTWEELKPLLSIVKNHALKDLIDILDKHKQRTKDPFLWGDEIEYSLVRFDHQNKRVQLSLKANEILSKFREKNKDSVVCQAEDCNFVVEAVPGKPYDSLLSNFSEVQSNMELRRTEVQQLLDENEYILSISAFPRLGCAGCTYPSYPSDPFQSFEGSISCPDQYKTPDHPRTLFLNRNVIERRGGKVSVNVPIYEDVNTAKPFEDDFSAYDVPNWENFVLNRSDGFIHLDSSSIGWGCCCLQVTFQASSFFECLQLYDQLIPLTPIFLGLSTACPIWRGYFSNVDSRWNILSDTTDDRTKDELEKSFFPSSRYSSVPCYLSQSSDIYNDLQLNYDENVYQSLLKHHCPSVLAKHFAHLFLRDPLYVTDEQVFSKDDQSKLFAFENHNSMVWNSLRLKPPVSGDQTSLGWRVEFRPMELQFNNFENAALAVFLSILTRAILSYGFDLRMPISQVNENMQRAQQTNLIEQTKFFFPKTKTFHQQTNDQTIQMSMNEIINGSKDFLGLIPLVTNYLNSFEDIPKSTRQMFDNYLRFISQRANGTILTNAMWIRQFLLNHPTYQHDSLVNEQMQYDLINLIQQMNDHQPSQSTN